MFEEHFLLKDLPFFNEAREADVQARQESLNQREERRQEGTLRRAPGEKCPAPLPPAGSLTEKKMRAPIKGIVIRSPVPTPPSSSSSESNPLRRTPGRYGSKSSVPASVRLATPVEEKLTVDEPGFPRPDPNDMQLLAVDKLAGGEVGFPCFEQGLPATIPVEESDAERLGSLPYGPDSLALVLVVGPAMGKVTPPCDLTSGFCERLQQRLLETIEVSKGGSIRACTNPG